MTLFEGMIYKKNEFQALWSQGQHKTTRLLKTLYACKKLGTVFALTLPSIRLTKSVLRIKEVKSCYVRSNRKRLTRFSRYYYSAWQQSWPQSISVPLVLNVVRKKCGKNSIQYQMRCVRCHDEPFTETSCKFRRLYYCGSLSWKWIDWINSGFAHQRSGC